MAEQAEDCEGAAKGLMGLRGLRDSPTNGLERNSLSLGDPQELRIPVLQLPVQD